MKKTLILAAGIIAMGIPAISAAAVKKHPVPKPAAEKPYSFPPSGKVLDRSDIVAFIRAVDEYHPKDQFASAFDETQMNGRTFSLDIPVSARFSEDKGSLGGWSYDKDTQTLNVELPLTRAEGWELLTTPDAAKKTVRWIDGFTLDEKDINFPPEVRSNAFGASVRVTSKSITHYGLAIFGPDRIDNSVDYSAKIPPDEARAMSQNIVLHLEGSLASFGMDKIVGCAGSEGHEATISEPYDLFMTKCMASARFTVAELRDKRDNQVLAKLTYLVSQ